MAGEWELDAHEKVAAALDDTSIVPNRDMWSSVRGEIVELDDVELLDKYVTRFGGDSIRRLNPAKGWRMPRSQAVLTALLRHGTNINACDWLGRTFLHYAICDNTTDRADWLPSQGADVNAIDHESGTTPLGIAAANGRLAMVAFLLTSGANVHAPIDAEWARPLSLAQARSHESVVEHLRKYDAS